MSKPCRKCGCMERTKSGHCKPCRKISQKIADAKFYAKNKEKCNFYVAEYYKKHPEKNRIKTNSDYARNKEKRAATKYKYRISNPEKMYFYTITRKAKKMNATPRWSNSFFIQEAYSLAKLRTQITGIIWEVDHIIPLQSHKVCGLHVENNLQVITRQQNRKKSNRFLPGIDS